MQYCMRMIKRTYWIDRIEKSWNHRPLVWLAGVRRAGKTVLCQSLDRVEYFDCEIPRVRQSMEDPEAFLRSVDGRRVALDEVHRLRNPSELLKIAADHFPKIRLIATASSTLHATRKFRDTLTGRKTSLWLTPMNGEDLRAFGATSYDHRLRNGGLPPFFLSSNFPERDVQDWLDSYWAKDIQELFRLERHASFQKFLELMFVRSSGIFEATAFAGPCEVSRTTIFNYLKVLEVTKVCDMIRPFSTRKSTEIVSAPKTYAFDTGFVAYFRGWNDLRLEDKGALWEHMVLNEIRSVWPEGEIRYWRDKQGHEVDFVLVRRGQSPLAVECKWSTASADPSAFSVFRHHYPAGDNWVITGDSDRPLSHQTKMIRWTSMGLREMSNRLASFHS